MFTTKNTFGNRLRRVLFDLNLTQADFAYAVGHQPDMISRLVNDKNTPLLTTIVDIYTAFPRLNPDWFLLGIEPVWKPDAEDATAGAVSERLNANKAEIAHLKEILSSAEKEINHLNHKIELYETLMEAKGIKRITGYANIDKKVHPDVYGAIPHFKRY